MFRRLQGLALLVVVVFSSSSLPSAAEASAGDPIVGRSASFTNGQARLRQSLATGTHSTMVLEDSGLLVQVYGSSAYGL